MGAYGPLRLRRKSAIRNPYYRKFAPPAPSRPARQPPLPALAQPSPPPSPNSPRRPRPPISPSPPPRPLAPRRHRRCALCCAAGQGSRTTSPPARERSASMRKPSLINTFGPQNYVEWSSRPRTNWSGRRFQHFFTRHRISPWREAPRRHLGLSGDGGLSRST